MYNAYEHEPTGIASGKKYDYCEYRRGHESGEPKVKTDFLLPVLKVQIILCIAIELFMLIMFKTQSSVFLFLRESYYNISSTDIPFAEVYVHLEGEHRDYTCTFSLYGSSGIFTYEVENVSLNPDNIIIS